MGEIAESESLAFRASPHPMWVFDRESLAFLDVNEAAVTAYGWSRDEFLGMTLLDIRPAEDRAGFKEAVTVPIRALDSVRRIGPRRHVTKGGRTLEVKLRSVATVHRGRAARLVMIEEMVSESEVEAVEALARGERRFRAMIEKSAEGISLTDGDGRTVYVSPAVSTLLGMPPGPGGCASEIHPDDREAVTESFLWLKAHPGESHVVEYRARHADGEWHSFEATGTNLLGDPDVRAIVGNFRDITERKRLTEQLLHAQKMEAIGRLAGGIAHDFNNVLAAISGYSQMAIADPAVHEPLRQDLREILGAAERGAGLTRQLLAFSRKQPPSPKALSLNGVVVEIEKMLRRTIGEDIEVVTELDPALGTVRADSGQIVQVLMNLAVNARDAMPSGGKLAVRTFNVELDAEGATKVPGAHPGRYVVIEVGDTGAGMDRSTLLRIFEPFFTTKGVGKGTGLGLSTVFGIVKQSDGLIAVKSAIGQGTEFRIYLPRIEGEVALVQAPPLRVPRGFGRVLVVEDDAQVREVIRRVMVGRGYEVIVASGMAAALATLQAVDGEVRLVLSDVVMQGGDGVALARRVRETWPGIPALLMSGHTDHPAMSGRECRVLQKPFTPAQLDQALDEAMKSDDSGAQVSASWATGAQPAARQKDCA